MACPACISPTTLSLSLVGCSYGSGLEYQDRVRVRFWNSFEDVVVPATDLSKPWQEHYLPHQRRSKLRVWSTGCVTITHLLSLTPARRPCAGESASANRPRHGVLLCRGVAG